MTVIHQGGMINGMRPLRKGSFQVKCEMKNAQRETATGSPARWKDEQPPAMLFDAHRAFFASAAGSSYVTACDRFHRD
jgi:hypothetical protein